MKIALSLAAAAAILTTPAIAADNDNFTGVRAGVTVGFDNITDVPDATDVVYGAQIGADAPLGDKFTLGAEAFTTNVFDEDRTIGAAARLGYAFNPTVLAYGRVGYTNYKDVFSRKLDGLSVGGGLELATTRNTYIKGEYRYTDFQAGAGSHAGLFGVGVRF